MGNRLPPPCSAPPSALCCAPSLTPPDHIAPWKIATSEPSFYRYLAGIKPNWVPVTDSKLVDPLWRNLLLSAGLVDTKDHSQKEGELHESRCVRDLPYTVV